MLNPKGMTACLRTGTIVAALAVLCLFPVAAHAQGSLGIGAGETTAPPTGMFSGTMAWIYAMQQDFYRSLTGALKAMREDPAKLWLLIGLSFAYGVFHAAGPGHGKAVISSYMLANEIALRRGIVLSFMSSLLQGLTAIIVIGAVFLLLRGSSVSMGDATNMLEVASYALITGFGAYLLWKKLKPLLLASANSGALSAASAGGSHVHIGNGHHHHHDDGEVCSTCGHSHAPDPKLLQGTDFNWKSAWTAIAAVGIRPCSGALIVLTFAFLNKLWLGGIASVLAMSIGTAITVSILASLAVTAKNAAMRFSGGGALSAAIHTSIEIAGALFVFLIGLLLLTANLSAPA